MYKHGQEFIKHVSNTNSNPMTNSITVALTLTLKPDVFQYILESVWGLGDPMGVTVGRLYDLNSAWGPYWGHSGWLI